MWPGRSFSPARPAKTGHTTAIACDPRYEKFVSGAGQEFLPIHSISSRRFLGALAKGKPFSDEQTLCGYVEEDTALIERTKPDLIVGDFRLSLSVSARRAGIPYATIINAYWSPFVVDRRLPMPVLPITRLLPLPAAGALFDIFSPFVSRQFCRPMNRVRAIYGMPALQSDLRSVYTDADHVLYADSPAMFATAELPDNHRHIGPILWAPPMPAPAWWAHIDRTRPVVYLTLGSSGPPALLSVVLEALSRFKVTVLVSTAGAPVALQSASHIHIADYLPGIEAAARSNLVICNGGSPTAHQALAAGVPVLGIASNMDQFLNMRAVAAAGAGLTIRADRSTVTTVSEAIGRLLSDQRFSEAAQAVALDFARLAAGTEFRRFVDGIGAHAPASSP